METLMLRFAPALLLLLCPVISHGESSIPTNYDECILDSMRGVSSDVAAHAIIASCRSLFPEVRREAAPGPAPAVDSLAPAAAAPPTQTLAAPAPLDTTSARELTAGELGRLRAVAKIFGSAYRVTVRNDNPNLALTEVTIAVWDDGDPVASRKEYSEAVRIAPQGSDTVKYTVHYRGDETGWNWGVVAARGVE
jgi:hypothetical protein